MYTYKIIKKSDGRLLENPETLYPTLLQVQAKCERSLSNWGSDYRAVIMKLEVVESFAWGEE